MSLTQHAAEPTHELGHTLDLVITYQTTLLAVDPLLTSYFQMIYALLFKLKTARPPLKVGRVSFRKLGSIDEDTFTDEI